MLRLFEVLMCVGAIIAALLLFTALASGMSAPQQGATAAIAVGFVVIPYCIVGMLQRKRLIERRGKMELAPLDF